MSRQDELGFHQGETIADADAWPTKGKIGVFGNQLFPFRAKTLWVKPFWVGKIAGETVLSVRGNGDAGAFWGRCIGRW